MINTFKSFGLGLVLSALVFIGCATPQLANAQQAAELQTDTHELVRAKVLTVLSSEERFVPGTQIKMPFQSLKIEIREGSKKGQQTTVENDHLNLKEGDSFYMQITSYPDGQVTYAVAEPIRLGKMLFFAILFLVLVFFFGGIQGIRGLLSLAGSLLLIFYVFLPKLLDGWSPILMSIFVSSLIIVLGSYVTHGFNRTTSSAVVGMLATVIFTGLMAFYAVDATRLTGFGSEDVVYLNFNTGGNLDVAGLLLGGIMIGLLGVLYDVAIGQAVTVDELVRAAPHMSRRKLFERASRVGREHIGALINTLAIAYVGAALPLLLLFYSSSSASILSIINREDFATEIMRTLIGSIGLVLAVPITSLVAVFMLKKNDTNSTYDRELAKSEEKEIEHSYLHGHSHGHSHKH